MFILSDFEKNWGYIEGDGKIKKKSGRGENEMSTTMSTAALQEIFKLENFRTIVNDGTLHHQQEHSLNCHCYLRC